MTNTEAPARIARVHVAEVVPSRYVDEIDTWETPDFGRGVNVRLYSRHQGHTCDWSIHLIGPDGSCRRVFQGPVEPGPYAFLVPQATVISAQRIPTNSSVELVEGDVIVIRGIAFRIDDSRGRFGHNPELIPITA